MKLFYTLADALGFIKKEIQRLEKELKKADTEARRNSLEQMIVIRLERGLLFYYSARPDERDPRLLDFFLDRVKERPDLKDFRKKLEKVQEMEGK